MRLSDLSLAAVLESNEWGRSGTYVRGLHPEPHPEPHVPCLLPDLVLDSETQPKN